MLGAASRGHLQRCTRAQSQPVSAVAPTLELSFWHEPHGRQATYPLHRHTHRLLPKPIFSTFHNFPVTPLPMLFICRPRTGSAWR